MCEYLILHNLRASENLVFGHLTAFWSDRLKLQLQSTDVGIPTQDRLQTVKCQALLRLKGLQDKAQSQPKCPQGVSLDAATGSGLLMMSGPAAVCAAQNIGECFPHPCVLSHVSPKSANQDHVQASFVHWKIWHMQSS